MGGGILSISVLAIGISGCASQLTLTPTELVRELGDSANARVLVFADKVDIKLSSGYKREIPNQSRWQYVGDIREGKVFRPIGIVFTIEGAHVREAQLVINNDRLVGFYLPGENTFSPLQVPISLPTKGTT